MFAIAWSDALWRTLEVVSGAPNEGALARARAAALQALASAFRVPMPKEGVGPS